VNICVFNKPFHPRSSCRRAQLTPGLGDQGSDTQDSTS
jgi:hypothetical protein